MLRTVSTRMIALSLLIIIPAHAQSELDLQSLIEEALANNPGLQALRHRWEAEEARIPQAGALADPMVKFELSNVPLSDFDFDSTPMSGKQLMLSQKLPYPGKRTAKERMAEHSASVAEEAYLDREGIIVNQVKQTYYSLAFLDHAIATTEKNAELLRDFVRIAETKYSVGRGLQQDVLKAQVTLSGLKNRLITLRQQRRQAEAKLNTVLNRLPQAPVGNPASISQTPFPYDVDTLQKRVLEHRPHLQGIQEEIRKWQAAEDLARKEYRPDFTVNLGYRQRDTMVGDPVKGSDFLSLGVALNLPIFRDRKQDQQVKEAKARRQTAEKRYEGEKQQIFLDVQDLFLAIQAHGQQVTLFKTTIIPQADQALHSAVAAYEVDKVDFLTLLNNQITLFNFEIDYYRHLTEYEKSLARMEAIVGERLF